MGIRTLIVDDEKPARLRLRAQLQKMPEIEVVGEAENGELAVQLIVKRLLGLPPVLRRVYLRLRRQF